MSPDPESLAAERERLALAFEYVDHHADQFVERLQRLVRMPSVSAHEQQLPETADVVEALARAAGAEVEQIPLDSAPPLVYGRMAGTGARTLLRYNHYDVQPADPLELWQSDPFGAEIRDGRIWGRGVSDNKGNLVARLCALELAEDSPLSVEEYRALFGIADFMRSWDGAEARRHWLFDPTCTISGLTSGYQGPGSKTVLPAEASAKVDFRLVPDQEPAEIIRLLRRHLDDQGFSDVEIVEIEGEGERASRTDPDAPIVSVVAETAGALHGQAPLILPTSAGTGPQHVLCGQFGVPAVGTGVGNPQSNNHAPNENILVRDYLEGIKHMVWLFERFGRVVD